MKKLITFVFCTILILSLTACVSSTKEAEDATMSDSEAVQLPNPFQECQSLEKAAELAGFEIFVPDAVGEYSERTIRVMENKMIEVLYHKQEDDSQIAIRKSPGSDDISGNFKQYKENCTVAVLDLQVTMMGDNGNVNTATWTDEDYSFSVKSTDSMDISTMEDLIQSVK